MTEAQPPTHDDLIRPFLHLPEGDRLYVCIVDEQRRAFDFTDNTFKGGNQLANIRDACLAAMGQYEQRADHEYSYRVEIDLARLLKGTNPATIPAEGAKVTIHWLRQLGDEPDVSADTQLRNTICLQNVGERFQPANKWDADQLDEGLAFARREKFAAEYRDFVLREIDTQDARRSRLATAVRSGSVAGVLRILAEDICNWAGNLKQHLLHQISHLAKDPFFARSRQVPDGAAFQVHESWAVRDWIGSHEAFDMLEFHKSADFARSFSARLDKLHEARVEFSHNVVAYTSQTRGEDVEGVFVLDEARKELKHRALYLAEYLDVIALQFEAAGEPKPPAEGQQGTNQDERSRSQEPLRTSRPPEGCVALLEEFAGALGAYTGLLNQIIIEALHPEIESFDDAINWTTSRQTDLAKAHERVERLAGKDLVSLIIAPNGTSNEQWMVHLLSIVAESYNAISYVFTSGPPQAKSDDLRAKMVASVVSRQLDSASNLVREIDACRRVLVATIQAKRPTPRSDAADAKAVPNAEESPKTGAGDSGEADEPTIEPASDDVLRFALPFAVMSAVGLRDLGRIRHYYPNVIPDEEARSLHDGFVTHLRSATETCKLERILQIGTIPAFEDDAADTELSAMMGVLALWHPDARVNKSASGEEVTKCLDSAITKCQETVQEPVRGMIERVINAMLFDCRVPAPDDDPSFREPQRFLQMLRLYWNAVRALVLHHIDAPASILPHPMMPIVMNLKARIDACLDQLAQLSGVDNVREQINMLVETILSGSPDDLQVVPEWSNEQVVSVDRFIEDGRLSLGAKTYQLTPAEEMCLNHAQVEVNRYVAQIDAHWARMLKGVDAKRNETAGTSQKGTRESGPVESPPLTPVEVRDAGESQEFSGGEVVFFEDRVEICGVDVCSGPRSGSRRVVLELLSRQKNGTTFVAYSGEELEALAKQKGARGTAGGWIRDLRDDIVEALRTQANIISGQRDVILSGGAGYRFAECLTVRYDSLAAITDITDTAEPPDVRDDDVRDVFDVRDDEASRRREWIIQQLEAGVQLKAPMVASQFKRSKKTAQRDLDALRDEGKIEFVGDPRTGFYRRRQSSDGGELAAPHSL